MLRLQQWEILCDWASTAEIEAVGRCQYNLSHNRAKIQLAKPEGLPDEDQDVHETLVHELLHLVFAPLMHYEGEAQQAGLEVACNRLSEALVALAREAVSASDR